MIRKPPHPPLDELASQYAAQIRRLEAELATVRAQLADLEQTLKHVELNFQTSLDDREKLRAQLAEQSAQYANLEHAYNQTLTYVKNLLLN